MYTGIPLDAWAVQPRHYRDGETLVGNWHKTWLWLRRDAIVSGIVTYCGRTYHPREVELIGDRPAPDGPCCNECFD